MPERRTKEPSDDEVADLRTEVARLRQLVGPSEESYTKLRLDVLAARDAAIAAEAEVGTQRGYVLALEAEVTRLTRDFDWFRTTIVEQLKRRLQGTPVVQRAVRRIQR